MISYYLTTAALGLGLMLAIIWLLRRDHLHLGHGLFWLSIAIVAAILGFSPKIIDRVATFMGFGYSPSFLLLMAVIVVLLKTLHADIVNTRLERQVRLLNQNLAILDADLRALSQSRDAT